MPRSSIGVQHRMAPAHRVSTPEAVATSLLALHSSDPASVRLALAARTVGNGLSVADVDRALYDDRSIVRVMGMRRTLWAVAADLVPVIAAACGQAIAARERRKLVSSVEDQGIASNGGRFVTTLWEQTLSALASRGEALTRELADDVPALEGTVRYGGNSKWATEVGLSSRIVLLLLCEGRILRSRPMARVLRTSGLTDSDGLRRIRGLARNAGPQAGGGERRGTFGAPHRMTMVTFPPRMGMRSS